MVDLDLRSGVERVMQIRSKQQVYTITLRFPKEVTRDVKVRASSREIAEHRALKRNPNALGIKTR